jgi:aquaporin Z
MATTAGQRYLAEFLGTFGLLLSVGGAAVFTITPTIDPFLRVVLISLSVGFGLVGMIYAFGDFSGAHFNPAVTVGAWVAGRFRGRDVVPYILSQLAGGVTGMGVIAGIASSRPGTFHSVQAAALASQCYSAGSVACAGYGWPAVFLLEAAFTFLLVVVVLLATREYGSAKNLAPLGIGLTLVMTNLIGIPIDGASINPARSFAPAVLSSLWGAGHWAIGQDWIFWVAPIVGGLFAALVDRALRSATG